VEEKIKILILIRSFAESYPKHKPKFETIKAIEKFSEVKYWYSNGNIHEIMKILNFTPDFIFHYDMGWEYALAPYVSGLDEVDIPKGCFVIDSHYSPPKRSNYFESNKMDLIFSTTKSHFLRTYPQFKDKFKWFPFSINSNIFKDYQLKKDIDFLLMGLVFDGGEKTGHQAWTPKGIYLFRDEVLDKMRGEKGFVYHPHPGHTAPANALVNEKYAKELNRSKMFFTCGSVYKYPVLKYFEAPACKTLLLAEPVPDILDLGFKDGVNFVACDRMNFYERAMYYLENENERIEITENGYEFIHANHTDDVRAEDFVNMIQEFIQNK
jgi:spore maturation protein CgeB